MEFKDKLRELRLENGMTQLQLGNMLCVSKMCVSHWEKGNSEPSIGQLKQLASIFETTVDDLIGLE